MLDLTPREGQLLGAVLHAQTSQEEVLAAVSGEGRLGKVATPAPPALVGMVGSGSGWEWGRGLNCSARCGAGASLGAELAWC